jgi:hypothetical protein
MAKIFLCHASEDRPQVREVYQHLKKELFEPWLDEEDLLPGQLWEQEIPKALKLSDFILIFFSRNSVAKKGFVQHEFKLAIDAWRDIPEGRIHTIPIRLDGCDIPEQFRQFHWVNLFDERGFERLLRAIQAGLEQRQQLHPETQKSIQSQDVAQYGRATPIQKKDFIASPIERTKAIVVELRNLARVPNNLLANEVVWFSGFLSSIAIDLDEPCPQTEVEYQKHLIEEKETLLELARHGCLIKCIITPPNPDHIIPYRTPVAVRRIENLIRFLMSEDKALSNIDWTVSEARQKNLYIIGNRSCFEGYKTGNERGFSRTACQTEQAIITSAISVYKDLFEELAEQMLIKYENREERGEHRQMLRQATINSLTNSLKFCKLL